MVRKKAIIGYVFRIFVLEAYKKAPSRKRWCFLVNSESISDYCFTTFAAWRPLGPWVMSNSTRSPSDKDLKPSAWIAEKWTKTSSPPSCSIKPNPLASLNHLTLPSANVLHHLSTSKIAHQIEKRQESEVSILAIPSFQADCTGNKTTHS